MKSIQIHNFNSATVLAPLPLEENSIIISKEKKFYSKLRSTHYSFKIPCSGTEAYLLNSKKILVDDTSFLITNATSTIEARLDSTSEVKGICIMLSRNLIENAAASLTKSLNNQLFQPFDAKKSYLFTEHCSRLKKTEFHQKIVTLKQDIFNGNISHYYESDSFFVELSIRLLLEEKEIQNCISKLPQSKYSTREELFKRLTTMNDYIHDNYTESLSLNELAQISHLSKFHAIRSYQRVFHSTPYQKIQELRLLKAKQLLLKRLTISEVAYQLGYSDPRTFSRLFIKYFRITPSQFRDSKK